MRFCGIFSVTWRGPAREGTLYAGTISFNVCRDVKKVFGIFCSFFFVIRG